MAFWTGGSIPGVRESRFSYPWPTMTTRAKERRRDTPGDGDTVASDRGKSATVWQNRDDLAVYVVCMIASKIAYLQAGTAIAASTDMANKTIFTGWRYTTTEIKANVQSVRFRRVSRVRRTTGLWADVIYTDGTTERVIDGHTLSPR